MVPKLRFKEYTDKWTLSTLSEAAVQIIDGDRGANYPSSDDFSSSGYCLFLNAGNVTKDGFKFDDVAFITEEKDALLRKGKISRGDLVLTTRGSVGNAALYNNDVYFENIRINSGMVIIRTQKKISPDFLYEYFKSNFFSTWLSKVAFGSAQPQLSVKIINELSIYFPESSEQSRIGNFLFAVDKKIALLDKQHKLLRQYKKGMMQNIFTQELRFKDENGETFPEWVHTSLGTISKVYDGTHQTPNYVEFGVPFYSVEHVTADDFDDTKYISEDVFEQESKRVSIQQGDILMTRIGDIGTVKYINWTPRASFYVSLSLIKVKESFDSKMISYCMQSDFFKKELHEKTIHVAFPKKINLGEISNCRIKMPSSKKEQTKISIFLSAIDDKIAVTKAELDALKTWKQGLLQQIFV